MSKNDGELKRWRVSQGQVVDIHEGGMRGYRGVARGHFGRCEIEAYAVPSGLEMYQRLEVRIVDWPASRWESTLVVINRKRAVQRFVGRFANLTEYE